MMRMPSLLGGVVELCNFVCSCLNKMNDFPFV